MEDKIKIESIQIRNIHGIEYADLMGLSAENVTILGGENGSGKSSFIQSIMHTFEQMRDIPETQYGVVNDNSTDGKGSVEMKLTNGYAVLCKYQKGLDGKVTQALTVKNDRGKAIASARNWTMSQVKAASFNPAEFGRRRPRDRAELLKELISDVIGCEYAKITESHVGLVSDKTIERWEKDGLNVIEAIDYLVDNRTGVVWNDRKEAKAEVKTLKGFLDSELGETDGIKRENIDEEIRLKDEKILIAEKLMAETTKECKTFVMILNYFNDQLDLLELQLKKSNEIIDMHSADFSEEHKKIAEYMAYLSERSKVYVADKSKLDSALAEQYDKVGILRSERSKLDKILDQVSKIEELRVKEAKITLRDTQIESLQKLRVDILKGVKMPVDGMEIRDEELWILDATIGKHRPFPSYSVGEKLLFACQIAMSTKPNFPVILIEDGSVLDQNTFNIIKANAIKNDWQMFIEWTTDTEPKDFCIMFEGGKVK